MRKILYFIYMPFRQIPLINGQIYHIYNRTIDNRRLFTSNKISTLLLSLLHYYRSTKHSMSYSLYVSLDEERRIGISRDLKLVKYFSLDLLAYCIMPTHIHLLIKQRATGAISKYMSDVFNSLTRFYNIKHKRKGPLLLPRFHAKQINSTEQLIHVSRYIHLNPYSSKIIKEKSEILNYPWSSMRDYLDPDRVSLAQTKLILNEFDNNASRYKDFVIENAEYQRTLELVKHSENW